MDNDINNIISYSSCNFCINGKGNAFTQTSFFPTEWTLENYRKVFEKTNFLLWIKNSLIICTSVAVLQLVLSVPAAFAFSKLRFWEEKMDL